MTNRILCALSFLAFAQPAHSMASNQDILASNAVLAQRIAAINDPALTSLIQDKQRLVTELYTPLVTGLKDAYERRTPISRVCFNLTPADNALTKQLLRVLNLMIKLNFTEKSSTEYSKLNMLWYDLQEGYKE